MGGLLPTDIDDPRNQGLLGTALAMLAASGPSPQRRTFGQILGASGLQGMQQYDQARVLRQRDEESKRRNSLADMQIRRMQQALAEEKQIADAARSSTMDRSQIALSAGGGPTVQNAETFNRLPEGATGFDQRAFTNKLFGINPLLAINMQKEMRAQNRPLILPNGTVLDQETLQPVYEPPTKTKDTAPPSSYREFEIAQANPDYQRFLDSRRTPPNLVIRDVPGKGTIAIDPRTGQPVGEPISPVQPKEIPNNVRMAVSSNDSLIKAIDDAIDAVDKNPSSFGLEYSLGDFVNQRYDPAGVPARAKVSNIGSKKVHERSGAAVSAREFPRLAPFIPAVNDTPKAVKDKLLEMRRVVSEETDALKFNYGEDSGYKPFQAGGNQTPQRGGMASEGRLPTAEEIDAELNRRLNKR